MWPIPSIQLNKDKEISEELLMRTDLFIYQDIRADNIYGYKLSAEYVTSKLKPECIKICIPNLLGVGKMFFQTQHSVLTWENVNNDRLFLFFQDDLIDLAFKASDDGNRTVTKIISYINEYSFNKDDVYDRFRQSLNELYRREQNWDIPIAEYIEKNFRTEKMFNDMSHPSIALAKYIMGELLKKIGICETYLSGVDEKTFQIGIRDTCLWDGIKRALNIKWEDEDVWHEDRYTKALNFDLKEYIRQYIWTLHGIFLED